LRVFSRLPENPNQSAMKICIRNLFIALLLFTGVNRIAAQGTTAFTYQGQLHDGGTNANGTYTMIFKLFDAVTNGNQIAGSITNNATLGNGLFSVNLDFGASAFNGSNRWLDITITNGGTTQTLSPRVQVLPVPYALYAAVAATVTNGSIMNAQLSPNAVASANIQDGAVANNNLAANAVNATNIAGGQVVKTLDGLADTVSLSAGTNVILTTNGSTLTISAIGGTNFVGISAGNNIGLLTNSGIVQISSFVPNIMVFSSVTNKTFTVPANVTRIVVEMWGAGGGGGAGNSSGLTVGGGGGAGAYAWNVFTNTGTTVYMVTAGSGGAGGIAGSANGATGPTSSFGALMSATGGAGGVNATTGGTGAGGAGGTATGSLINVQGGSGDNKGDGGGIWRGNPGALESGSGGSGPGAGGSGGGPGPPSSPGNAGSFGLVIVYY
jgi:hypothetical protein